MSGSISSADPNALFRYADTGGQLNERLRSQGRRLADALSRFSSSCTERRIGIDSGLADGILAHSTAAAVNDNWLRRVGQAFMHADTGWVSQSSWRAASSGAQQIERSARSIGDAASWLRSQNPSPALGALREAMSRTNTLAAQIVGRIRVFLALGGGGHRVHVCVAVKPSLWEQVVGAAKSWLSRGWDWLTGLVRGAFQKARQLLAGVWNGIVHVARDFGAKTVAMVSNMVLALKQLPPTVIRVLQNVSQAGGWLFSSGIKLTGDVWTTGTGFVTSVLSGAWNQAQRFGSWVLDGARWMGEQIGNLLRMLGDAFRRTLAAFGAGLNLLFKLARALTHHVVGFVVGAVRHIISAVKGFIVKLASWAMEALQTIFWNAVALALKWALENPWILAKLSGVLALALLTNPLTYVVVGLLFATGTADDVGRLTLDWLLDSMRYADPKLRIEVAKLLDERLGNAAAILGLIGLGFAENRDPCKDPASFDPEQVFPGLRGDEASARIIPTAALMSGDNALISRFKGEQVSMAKLRQNEYLIAVNGLNVANGAYGSPNDLEAVMKTAELPIAEQFKQNEYYRKVRAEFLAQIREVPRHAVLNLTGHSMGAGVTMLLLNDPEVQERLAARDITVKSVTTFGMVRPKYAQEVPPHYGAEVRHYVDKDDRLAMEVGAGHEGQQDTHFVTDRDGKQDGNEDAVTAHTTYNNKVYPDGHDTLPFTVDTENFSLNRRGW